MTWVIALLSAVGLPIAAIKLYEFYRMDIFRPHAFEEALGDMRRGKTAGLGARLMRWPIRPRRLLLLP